MKLSTKRSLIGAVILLLMTPAPGSTGAAHPARAGTVVRHDAFESQNVLPRNVDVWLPPGYSIDEAARYPVIYMHDGENLFDAADAKFGVEWGLDEVMTELIAAGEIRPAIVVGIWSLGAGRYAEYMPQKAAPPGPIDFQVPSSPALTGQQLVSDRYLRFLVTELKPFIDGRYRTLPGRDDTFLMGSSMGGLISAYAISEYPDTFGGAACVSTHWPAGHGVVAGYLATHLPDPATHRIYFDFGTQTLDAGYEPFQRRMDEAMRRAGFVEGRNWVTLKFGGAEHNETSWRERAHVPLKFLLGAGSGVSGVSGK